MTPLRCNYAAARVDGLVLVEDLGAPVSVVNDAEAVADAVQVSRSRR